MVGSKKKLIRITTVPQSLQSLLKGQLKYMNTYFDVLAVSSDASFFEEMLEEQEVRGVRINMTRKITPFTDLISLYRLVKLFRKERPYIVHSHTPKAGILAMLAAKITGVPHRLHTVAGMPLLITMGFTRRILNIVERLTYGCATKVLPNSFAMRDIILDNKLTKSSKLQVIANGSSNGIDTTHFSLDAIKNSKNQLREEFGYSEKDFIFIFVGRLVADKGINELVEAFSKLYDKYDEVKLLLVGPYEDELDPLKNSTRDTIENHKAIKAVGFQKDVRPFFKMADALAFPSYREGFPNVVMQAGSMELPSIVTDINGCNEIIIDRKNGLIIPSKSVESLYIAMEEFIFDKELVNSLKSNSRKLIVDRYQQEDVWQAILKMYQELEQ